MWLIGREMNSFIELCLIMTVAAGEVLVAAYSAKISCRTCKDFVVSFNEVRNAEVGGVS